MILVSACLVGENCRYNGTGLMYEELKKMVDTGMAIKVCPELQGGLKVPRKPCELKNINGAQRVIDDEGNDYTKAFVQGAFCVLEICKLHNIKIAVLKSRSPSCGFGEIYNGEFNGTIIKGNGITAECLTTHGIEVYTELNFNEIR
ncbi:MAG: DUF523 domain-containing protein [Bacteroidales bacterium]|nr:DUF523 domain-containing protein [Bacteroidales bacterium]